jgi:hypothetical protein
MPVCARTLIADVRMILVETASRHRINMVPHLWNRPLFRYTICLW